MDEKIKKIAKNFNFEGELIKIEENKQGNINRTYILTYKDKDIKKYLLQMINVNVFKEPELVMQNIELITKHLKDKLITTDKKIITY